MFFLKPESLNLESVFHLWPSVALFNNFGNDKQSATFFGRVAERVFVGKRRADFVGAGDVDQRDGVRGRLDVGHIQLAQFFDVAENPAELRGKFFLLVGRERDARKMRDVFDIKFNGSHEMSFKFQVESFKLKRFASAGSSNGRLEKRE